MLQRDRYRAMGPAGAALRLRSVALLAIVALLAVGCSRKGATSSSGNQKIVKLGFVAPLTGPLSSLGLGMKNSVDLAINQANKANKINGWKIVLDAQDDGAKPDTGAAAASRLASEPDVAAVVGPLNSSVAQQVAPILDRAGIGEISPANTNPTLSRGPNADTNPRRVWHTYFRVCTIDSLQGPFAAQYAYSQAGFRTVATVNDKKTYGQGLVEAFEGEWKKLGGKIASHDTVSENDRDFGALTPKIVAEKPGFVYYGGEFPVAAPLSAQLGKAGFKGPVMGGDGIQAGGFLSGGGRAGDLATNVGAPASRLPAAASFISAYQAAAYKDPFESYGPLTFDAANILIEALAKVLPSASDVASARPLVLQAVQQTQGFQGVSGTTTFDQFGDTSNKLLTVYKDEGKDWKDTFTGTFQG